MPTDTKVNQQAASTQRQKRQRTQKPLPFLLRPKSHSTRETRKSARFTSASSLTNMATERRFPNAVFPIGRTHETCLNGLMRRGSTTTASFWTKAEPRKADGEGQQSCRATPSKSKAQPETKVLLIQRTLTSTSCPRTLQHPVPGRANTTG